MRLKLLIVGWVILGGWLDWAGWLMGWAIHGGPF